MTTRTIRLIERSRDSTLTGYIFTDFNHAREFLTQSWVKPERFTLEEVAAGDFVRCTKCDGLGHTRRVTALRKLTVEEFLQEDTTHEKPGRP